MVKKLILVLTVFSIVFPVGLYLYSKGLSDGIAMYKHSYNMIKALESAYNYGLRDGYNRNY